MDGERALVLDDGTVVRGRAFGAEGSVFGELVFNTGMTGYQEELTDTSYKGQLLLMTYPLVGNYGISATAFESSRVQAAAAVVREHCAHPSHRECQKTLDAFLRDFGVPGLSGVDTRWLTLKTRERGTMRAGIVPVDGVDEALGKVRSMPFPDTENLVSEVSTRKAVTHPFPGPRNRHMLRVVAVDCGIKTSIVRHLNAFAEVVQVPYSASADEILAERPDGVLISNGPGNPAHPAVMATTVRTARALAGQVPLMGICLGHQIIALAFGGRTFKLKFGHRGSNQPVRDLRTRKVVITSQNHGFAVDPDMPSELELTEVNVNDGTVEALRHRELPVFSVEYHPEAAPGPRDARYIFDQFRQMIQNHRGATG